MFASPPDSFPRVLQPARLTPYSQPQIVTRVVTVLSNTALLPPRSKPLSIIISVQRPNLGRHPYQNIVSDYPPKASRFPAFSPHPIPFP